MAAAAIIAAQTAPAPAAARIVVPAPVPRERPVPAVLPDRSGSGEAAARFSTLLRERGQQAKAAPEQTARPDTPPPSAPFLAQWFGQERAAPDKGTPSFDDAARHAAIAAYRRSQAVLGEAPLVFGASEIVSAALGQRVDLVG